MTRSLACLALILLIGCQAEPEPPGQPLGPPARLVDRAPPAPAAPVAPPPDLCAALAGIVATETDGFATLRAEPVAARSWRGRAVPPGTERCTIEGDAWPHARYLCAGAPFATGQRDGAQAAYQALVRKVDQCLTSPIWFPRDWRRGEPFEFAMGERLQTWTDHSTLPPSQVVLKVQQDLTSRAYQVQLSLEAVP